MLEVLAVGWIFFALFGLGVNIFTLQDAKADKFYVDHFSHKGTRLIVAKGNIRRERVRSIIQSVFFLIGLVALKVPPPQGELTTVRSLISAGFIVVAALTVYNSFQDRRDRIAINLEIRRQTTTEEES